MKVPGLRVIARTSAFAFKGQNTDIRKIAETLGVSTVLEGSVRRAGNRIRVTAQLITAADGSHLWSERYDREMADVFAVQDEIATAITGALQVKLVPAKPRYTPKMEAYEAVLRARHEMQRWTPEAMARTKSLYLRAIEIDPQYPLARCELALNYFQLAVMNLLPPKEAAERLRKLSQGIGSDLAEVHAVHALIAILDYRWEQASEHFRLAFAREAPNPLVSRLYATFFLGPLGREREALECLESALRQDPLNLALRVDAAFAKSDGRVTEREMLRILEDEPDAWVPSSWLAAWYTHQGELEKARVHGERVRALIPSNQSHTGLLAAVLSRVGGQDRAAALLKELGTGEALGEPMGWSCYHAGRGEPALAAEWLEKAIDQRSPQAPFVFPRFSGYAFKSTAYWPPLARKMNLA